MKTLFLIAITCITLQAVAQDKRKGDPKGDRHTKKEMMKNLSAEEIATLGSKKLTLTLDLSQKQQSDVKTLLLEHATVRKQRLMGYDKSEKDDTLKKSTKEDRVKRLNDKLDRKIAMTQKMKSILTTEQYDQWIKIQARRQGISKNTKERKTKR